MGSSHPAYLKETNEIMAKQTRSTIYGSIRSVFGSCPILKLVTILSIILSISGCSRESTDRLVWSADGQRAIVFASDGIRVTDADGKLTKVLLQSAEKIAWMPDRKSFAALTGEQVKSWDELREFLSASDEQRIIEAVRQLKEFAQSGRNWNKLSEKEEEQLSQITENINVNDLILYFRTFESDTLKKLQIPDQEMNRNNLFTLRIHKLDGERVEPGLVLYQTHREIGTIKVPAGGEAIALVEDGCLKAVPSKGGAPLTVAESVSPFFDWTDDGKDLVYIKKLGSADASLGSVEKASVLRNGHLVKQVVPIVMARSVFSVNARVQCTAGGRVYFSSAQSTIPCDPNSQSENRRIYALLPGTFASVISIIPDSYLQSNDKSNCEFFSASPNGRKIAILHGNGILDIFDTSSGNWNTIQDTPFSEECAFFPQWRSDDELCFAGPLKMKDQQGKRIAEVLLWSDEKAMARVISKDWPTEAGKFLENDDDKTKDKNEVRSQ